MDMDEVKGASREELVRYLENRGFQCYDHEPTDELREAARLDIEVALTE